MNKKPRGVTRSTCPYCGVGCGVLIELNIESSLGGITVKGDPEHPANRGKLCSKGAALGETVGTEHRLLAPTLHGEQIDWNTALDTVAIHFKQAIAQHGPDSVAFYVSGQLLTEDYYVANKLMKGFMGSANIDTNSRLCMASTVAGQKRAFGTDTVPGTYDDLDEADVVVLVGSNLAWCHPVLYQRVMAAKETRGTKIITIDPRRTASCDDAIHVQIRAGSDVALFNALLVEIERRGAIDTQYAESHVDGLADALAAAKASDATLTGLSDTQLQAFTDVWISNERVVTIFSQGVNQSSSGTDKVNAILNCHLATGRIGKPGMGPFSVTGQVNAMGGREVGGLANMLACHLDIDNPTHSDAVQSFWNAPVMPTQVGLKAVDLFQAVGSGKIKALWVIHTNPVVSMPDADEVKAAIQVCPFVVVSDITTQTDTALLADMVLPATAWAEKSGTVTNSDRTISRQRAVLPAPGDAKPDWWMLAQVAQRMGWKDAFAWDNIAQIFTEYAALSGVAGKLGKDFDISSLSNLSEQEYDELEPARWPQSSLKQGGRFFADGGFFHPNGKAKMLALAPQAPAAAQTEARPFRLNSGRLRDQWHTMTRTSLSARLSAHLPEPFVDMNPKDAKRLGLEPGDLVRLTSAQGSAILRLHETPDVVPGDLFVPIHWTGMNAPSARIDALVAPVVDPVSSQPESKASTVAAAKYEASWYGFAISVNNMVPSCGYWAQSRTNAGFRCELAGAGSVEGWTSDDWEIYARDLFGLAEAEVQQMSDSQRGRHRMGFFDGETLLAALYVAPEPVVLMRDFLVGLPGQDAPWAMAGQASGGMPDPGPVVCSCFAVGRNTIKIAIEDQSLSSVVQIGECLSAGTSCGSCKAELAALLKEARAESETA